MYLMNFIKNNDFWQLKIANEAMKHGTFLSFTLEQPITQSAREEKMRS